jgi:hypothetical protein
MGIPATLIGPVGGITIDRTQAQNFLFQFNPNGFDDFLSAYEVSYVPVGGGTTVWSGTIYSWSTDSSGYVIHNYPANTFTAGVNYQWRVMTYDKDGLPSITSWGYFFAAAPPAAPTVTSPTAGQSVSAQHTVTWTVTNQTRYQLEVRTAASGGGSLEGYTLDVTNSAHRSAIAYFPTNSVSRYVRLRVQYNGLWSTWVERQVNVSWVPPHVPQVTADPGDPIGLGFNHDVLLAWSHPTPSGGSPAVTTVDLFYKHPTREGWTTIELGRPVAQPAAVNVHVPSGTWDFMVIARAANGTFREGFDMGVTSQIRGVVLYDPLDWQFTLAGFRLNEDGAEDTLTIEAASNHYHGREFPQIEYGDGASRTINVPNLHLRNDDELYKLRLLIARRQVLCYRDYKGRKVFGLVQLGAVQDTFYGYLTSLTVQVGDAWEPVPGGGEPVLDYYGGGYA